MKSSRASSESPRPVRRFSSSVNREPAKSWLREGCTTAAAAAKARSFRSTPAQFRRSWWRASSLATRRALSPERSAPPRASSRLQRPAPSSSTKSGRWTLSTQISLLRVLETYRFTRVGANKERDADVRVIAATNRDLLDLVEANQFREDLYYRLNVFTIAIPPLRERAEDIVPIAERFLRFFGKRYGTPARCLSDKALERLLGHQWPGNVRELRNVMEQTAVFAQREVVHAEEIQFISTRLPNQRVARAEAREQANTAGTAYGPAPVAPLTDMPAPLADSQQEAPAAAVIAAVPGATQSQPAFGGTEVTPSPLFAAVPSPTPTPSPIEVAVPRGGPPGGDEHPLVLRIPVGTPLAEAERLLIIKTLEVSDGNKQRAARILGISRRGLYTKLAAYGEHVPAEEAAEAAVNDAPGT